MGMNLKLIEVPATLHSNLKKIAKSEGMTMKGLAYRLLSENLGNFALGAKPKRKKRRAV